MIQTLQAGALSVFI